MKAIKAKLSKFSTVDEYIHGWGLYYFGTGILLPTRKAQPEGTEVSLQIDIATGETVLRGEGVVEEVRTNSEGGTVGMVIRFTRLDARSKELVQRILDHKKDSRTSGASVVPAAPREDTHLSGEHIGAIADALDETFDSIFGGGTGAFPATPDTGAPTSAPATTSASEPVAGNEAPATAAPARRRAPTVTAVNEALARLGLSGSVPAVEDADDEAGSTTDPGLPAHDSVDIDAPAAAAPDERGDTSADTPGADDEAATDEDAAAATAESEAGDAPTAAEAAETGAAETGADEPDAAETGEGDDGGGDAAQEDASDDPSDAILTHDEPSRSDAFRAAEAGAADSAARGEAALDQAVASLSSPNIDIAKPAEPTGLIARFIAWLKGLFGGK